ncbi:MAG TPA: hypothetical protein VE287_01720, partial [Actinopolymorphaceae bacterium]|nr:hypothetical protein [Actinopolymorphaceae bacterium]
LACRVMGVVAVRWHGGSRAPVLAGGCRWGGRRPVERKLAGDRSWQVAAGGEVAVRWHEGSRGTIRTPWWGCVAIDP